jgi:hypothetical protein
MGEVAECNRSSSSTATVRVSRLSQNLREGLNDKFRQSIQNRPPAGERHPWCLVAKNDVMGTRLVFAVACLLACSNSALASDVCSCKGYAGPGGPCYSGPGGRAYNGPGGPAYAGPGGRCYAGPGGPSYSGPGGPSYSGPGGPAYSGPGGPKYNGYESAAKPCGRSDLQAVGRVFWLELPDISAGCGAQAPMRKYSDIGAAIVPTLATRLGPAPFPTQSDWAQLDVPAPPPISTRRAAKCRYRVRSQMPAGGSSGARVRMAANTLCAPNSARILANAGASRRGTPGTGSLFIDCRRRNVVVSATLATAQSIPCRNFGWISTKV